MSGEENGSTEEKKGEETPKEAPQKKIEPKADDKPKRTILDDIEQDFIKDLKDIVSMEDYADLDQETRIKVFRGLKKTLAGLKKEEPKKKEEKQMPPKGVPNDPTGAPPQEEKPYMTNLQRNNLQDYRKDIQKRTSIHNITNQIRGK